MTLHREEPDVPGEREKMLAGEMYDPLDPELVVARQRARDLCQALNDTRDRPDGFLKALVTP